MALDKVIQWEIVAYSFRTLLIGCSVLFGYLGYRLFRLGVYEKQGELRAIYKGASLTVRQFGPGLGFALLAVPFAAVAMSRGISVQNPAGLTGTATYTGDIEHYPVPAVAPKPKEGEAPTPVQFSLKDKSGCPATVHPNEKVPPNCGEYLSAESTLSTLNNASAVVVTAPGSEHSLKDILHSAMTGKIAKQ